MSGLNRRPRWRRLAILVILTLVTVTAFAAATVDQSFDAMAALGPDVNGSGAQIGGGQSVAQTFTVGISGRLTRVVCVVR